MTSLSVIPQKKLPTAHAKKRNNFKMASQLKLKIHLLVHSGEKPFVCSWCNYSCTEAGTLKVHMRIHWGKRPYSCKKWDYSCTRASILSNTYSLIQEKNNFSALSASLLLQEGMSSKSNCQLIKGKSISAVTSKKCIFSCQNSSNLNYQMLSHIG